MVLPRTFDDGPAQPAGGAASFYRPTRGAIRLDALRMDPEPLQADVRRIEQASQWKPLKDGRHWAQIVLLKNEFRHPLLRSCPGLERALAAMPSRVLDACLKLLAPGGFVHEHRDITGASPMGVLRLHVPIVTDPRVEFYVNGRRVALQPGEAWILDTSYRHRVANHSTVRRVHLVVDVEADRALRALLPPRDVWDRLHDVHFWLLCALKGLAHIAKPRHLRSYVRLFVEQRIMRRSTLP
jgi:hypothetical protein